MEILTFTIDEEIFGIDVSNVSEIIRADYHITPIPKSNECFIGMFQPRDQVLTAINLRKCLFSSKPEIKRSEEELHNNYYIMRETYAWLVDSVKEIMEIDESKLIEPSKIISTDSSFVIGIYKNENDLIQVIDFDLIIKKITADE